MSNENRCACIARKFVIPLWRLELRGGGSSLSFLLNGGLHTVFICHEKVRYCCIKKWTKRMIDKQLLTQTVEQAIENTDLFIVDIKVNPGNAIVVELDSETGIDIDMCVNITRKIESVFDRDVEDYELEVGSAGLTAPFKVRGQYLKNIGNDIEVLTCDGRKLHGVLTEVGDDEFTVEIEKKVKEEGAKRPTLVKEPLTFKFNETKSVKYLINFK